MGNPVVEKSKSFAVRIVRLCQYLSEKKNERALTGQLLRCGTGIGVNVREATRGMSKKDFIYKMNLALKGCAETGFWLELMHETGYLDDRQFKTINDDCEELIAILVSIVKTARKNNQTESEIRNRQ